MDRDDVEALRLSLIRIEDLLGVIAQALVAKPAIAPADIQCPSCARFGRVISNCPLCHGQGG